jgi:DNA polymerase/3'-5' exonuclease PolX
VALLQPACERIEIAGSIRRKKTEIGDIEIVCIPLYSFSPDLFGDPVQEYALTDDVIKAQDWKTVKNGKKYKQFVLEGGAQLDLFLVTPETWGLQLLIRTGPADFSHRLVTGRRHGGCLPAGWKVKDGRLHGYNGALETTEERDVFAALGMDWIAPEDRQ